jgi:hypothetical protein
MIRAGLDHPGLRADIDGQADAVVDELIRHYDQEGPGFCW